MNTIANRDSRIGAILRDLLDDRKINIMEALAILRCLEYSGQISDVSIGNAYREDISALLERTV